MQAEQTQVRPQQPSTTLTLPACPWINFLSGVIELWLTYMAPHENAGNAPEYSVFPGAISTTTTNNNNNVGIYKLEVFLNRRRGGEREAICLGGKEMSPFWLDNSDGSPLHFANRHKHDSHHVIRRKVGETTFSCSISSPKHRQRCRQNSQNLPPFLMHAQ